MTVLVVDELHETPMNVKITKHYALTVEVIVSQAEAEPGGVVADMEDLAEEIETAAYAVVAQHHTRATVRCRPDGPFWMERAK